ncbi:hypothetical protein [Enterococcus mundtii]|nr:hypothetical protein [Enterococcus mundtii]
MPNSVKLLNVEQKKITLVYLASLLNKSTFLLDRWSVLVKVG